MKYTRKILSWPDYSIKEYSYKSIVGIIIGLCVSWIIQTDSQETVSTLIDVFRAWMFALAPIILIVLLSRLRDKPSPDGKKPIVLAVTSTTWRDRSSSSRKNYNLNKKEEIIREYVYDFIPGLYSAVSVALMINIYGAVEKSTVGWGEEVLVGIFLTFALVAPVNVFGYLLLNAYEKGREGVLIIIVLVESFLIGNSLSSQAEYILNFGVSILKDLV